MPEYNLTVRSLPEEPRLEINGSINVPAADSVRETIELDLSQVMGNLIFEVLEPSSASGPAQLLKKADTPNPIGGPGTTTWSVRPPHPIPANTRARLKFSYATTKTIAWLFFVGREVSFAVGDSTKWYPQLPNSNGIGIGRIDFTTNSGFIVASVGKPLHAANETTSGQFRFSVAVPTVFTFALGPYTVAHREGVVPLSAFLLRPRENIKAHLDGCSQVLSTLIGEFGPNPYNQFAIVEVPQAIATQMGFSGASLQGLMLVKSDMLDEDFNLAFYGHEIGHQWWGNLVTMHSERGEYMFGEGLAEFGSLLVVEAIEGREAAERFRRRGYPGSPERQSGFGYLQLSAAALDEPLAHLGAGTLAHELATSKGFLVWDLLSRTVGRVRFRQALQHISREFGFRSITWEDFLRIIESQSEMDLRWFFEQWFERTGVPSWRVESKQTGKTLRIIVAQDAPFYSAKVEVEARGDAGSRMLRGVAIRGARTEFTLAVNFPVRSVTLDPHFLIPHWSPDYRAAATAMASYTSADMKRKRGKLDEAQREFRAALESDRELDVHGLCFMLNYGLARALSGQQKVQEARGHLEAALRCPVRPADVLPLVYLELAGIAKQTGDQTTLTWAAGAAIAADAAGGSGRVTRRARALLQQ